jgi:hypothetical protein
MQISDSEIEKIVAKLKTLPASRDAALADAARPDRRKGPAKKPERWKPGSVLPGLSEAAFRLHVKDVMADPAHLLSPFSRFAVVLNKPLLIWQLQNPHPHNTELVDSHVEPYNNWIKVNAYSEGGSFWSKVVFYYFWQNDTGQSVSISAEAPIVASGSAFAGASSNSSLFSLGNRSESSVVASLLLQRWLGWGDLDGFDIGFIDAQQGFLVAHAYAEGGFFSGDTRTDKLDFRPYFLEAKSVQIPAAASMMFRIELTFSGWADGGTLSDQIWAVFEEDGIYSPYVRLDIRTTS